MGSIRRSTLPLKGVLERDSNKSVLYRCLHQSFDLVDIWVYYGANMEKGLLERDSQYHVFEPSGDDQAVQTVKRDIHYKDDSNNKIADKFEFAV